MYLFEQFARFIWLLNRLALYLRGIDVNIVDVRILGESSN